MAVEKLQSFDPNSKMPALKCMYITKGYGLRTIDEAFISSKSQTFGPDQTNFWAVVHDKQDNSFSDIAMKISENQYAQTLLT